METCTEEIIITACQKQDPRAQRKLYQLYKDSIYTLAYRMCGDIDLASIVVQECFLAAFRSIHNFHGQSGLYSWLRTILIRVYIRQRKSFYSELNLKSDHVEDAVSISFTEEIDSEMIQKCFMDLPEGYRTILTLYFMEEMTHPEIAEMLSISVGTSKSQLHHAKKKLKTLLEKCEL